MTAPPRTDASSPAYSTSSTDRRWTRAETARHLVHLEDAVDAGRSERDFEETSGVPRSTFRYWARRRDDMDVSPAVVHFFESPEGLVFLHRLVVAALFVMTLRSPDGVRVVCEFLELSGLGDLVASSFGSVRAMANRMQVEVVQFAEEQRASLAAQMAPKKITVCQDETFHPEICLVAVEPVSNFILLEAYADHRDADTWTIAMKGLVRWTPWVAPGESRASTAVRLAIAFGSGMTEPSHAPLGWPAARVDAQARGALADLPVDVVQCTSDEAKALLAHAKNAFDAHHSPDVFHVQHEVSRAVGAPLGRRIERAKLDFEAAVLVTEQLKADHVAYKAAKHGPGHPPDFAGRIAAAQQVDDAARLRFEGASKDRDEERDAVRGISAAYHPYRLSDGARQSVDDVRILLDTHFDIIQAIADRADLPERCHKGIAKARRVSASMVDTIRFAHTEINDRLATLQLPSGVHDDVRDRLVPGLYLQRVANRAATSAQRSLLSRTADELLAPLRVSGHALQALDDARRQAVAAIAQQCADIFQRSTSCVEGRNGQLSLYHHGLHRFSASKLAALTAIHNYYVTRDDGTSAAERFFGCAPDDLFETLIARMPAPARPAQKRAVRRSTASVLSTPTPPRPAPKRAVRSAENGKDRAA